jgi:hypothetical protein
LPLRWVLRTLPLSGSPNRLEPKGNHERRQSVGAVVAGPRNQDLIAISVRWPASGGLFHSLQSLFQALQRETVVSPEIHPVESSAECTLGCVAFGVICTGDAAKLNTKVRVSPKPGQSLRPFDGTCTIGIVSSGDPHINGPLPDNQCPKPATGGRGPPPRNRCRGPIGQTPRQVGLLVKHNRGTCEPDRDCQLRRKSVSEWSHHEQNDADCRGRRGFVPN